MNKQEEIQMMQYVLEESKEVYQRNLQNSDKIDTKLIQFFTFNSALLLLFIKLIAFPSTVFHQIIYFAAATLFVGILILLITAYRPLSYRSIDPNQLINKFCQNKYRNRKELLGAIAGTTAENSLSVKKNINRKALWMNVCAFMLVGALLLTLILNVIQEAI